MRSLSLPPATEALARLRANAPGGPWSLLEPQESRELRDRLQVNQDSVCAWCEVSITLDGSHSDHIRSRNRFPQLTFQIENLVAACTCLDTCGHGRQGKGDLPAWIHPYESADLETHFRFEADGSINAALEIDEARAAEAEHAIRHHLNLNHRTLKERRETQMAMIHSYCGQEFLPEDIASFFSDFPTLTRQLLS